MSKPCLVVLAPEPLFLSFFAPKQLRRLSRSFSWKRNQSRKVSPQLKRELAGAQALITTWDSPAFADELLELAPKLRTIAHCGGEVKSRFRGSLLDRLTIITAPEPMGRATAELGAALVLYCGRNVEWYREELRKPTSRIYESVHARGTPEFLIGRRVGMLGFGRIARTVVDLLRPFEITWQVHDPYAPREVEQNYPVRLVSLTDLLKSSGLLLLTAALTDETRGILDKKKLALLPVGATVINIARGGLLDLDALTNQVRRGKLCCALDVTDPLEPLPKKHPLRRLNGAIVTPHMGGGSRVARNQMADVLLDDLESFFRGDEVKNRVTTAMLARMT
jgi:phosphoglycerate dehydrogenase-like enzyme